MRRYLWNFYKLIVSQGKYSQINHVLYLRRNIFEIVVTENKRIDFHIAPRICSPIIIKICDDKILYYFCTLSIKRVKNGWSKSFLAYFHHLSCCMKDQELQEPGMSQNLLEGYLSDSLLDSKFWNKLNEN